MRTLVITILFSIGGLSICHANVTYNPHTGIYTVDTHGAIDLDKSEKINFSESGKISR